MSIDHHLEVDVMIGDIDQVRLIECGIKFPCQMFRVYRTHPERDECSYVSEHGRPHPLVKLVQILMAHDQVELVFARLRQDIGKTQRQKTVDLINVQMKWPSF